MLVSQLSDRLQGRRESFIKVSAADIVIDQVAASLTVRDRTYQLDEPAEKALAKFLGIPHGYLKSCPPPFKSETERFWLDQISDVDVKIYTLGDEIVSMGDPDLQYIPTEAVGEVITNVFSPLDRVDLYRGPDYVQFDVVTLDHTVEVPNPDGLPYRPEVGDITHGGVRLLSYPHTIKAPSASAYFERYVCTNGMCTDQSLGRINIKGNTVPEIIEEMESKARHLLGALDDGLAAYAATATKKVPGNIQAFVHQLSKEYGFTRAILDEVMGIVNQLGPEATVYDVLQAFTSVANRVESTQVKHKLQTLGGALALESDKMLDRCGSCERLL